MTEGITGNQLEAGVVTILSQAIELTDAQIRAAPTTPTVIVPATEVLGYVGLPTQIPLPLAFVVSANISAGAYTNVDPVAAFIIAVGSDWSLNGLRANVDTMAQINDAVSVIGIANSFDPTIVDSTIIPLHISSGGIQDNALAFVINNNGAGNLTGGNAANSMKVTVLYTVIDV